jgi:septal ring factor EnvC (AmiA/AmiB activator)
MPDSASHAASRLSIWPAVLTFGALVVFSAQAEPADRDLRLRGIRAEIRRLEGELRDLQGREAGLIGEVERLGAELRLREAEMEEVGLRLGAVSSAISQRTRRLEHLERAQDDRRGYLAFRLREIYKSGPNLELRRFLGDAGIARYWEGVRYAAYLSERDARVLRAYRRDAERLNEERAGLEAERSALDGARRDLVAARRRLEASRAGRRRLLEEIRGDQGKRRVALQELEQAANELSRLIDSLGGAAEEPTLDMTKFQGLLDWPCDGEVAAGFGTVVHPRFKTRLPHPGLDIDGELGSAIRAIFDGRVVFAAWMRGYGLTAIVDHGRGLLSIYAHASVLMVESGQQVVRGQRIGAVGDTGSLRGAYLYFELRQDGRPIDPAPWLRPRRPG